MINVYLTAKLQEASFLGQEIVCFVTVLLFRHRRLREAFFIFYSPSSQSFIPICQIPLLMFQPESHNSACLKMSNLSLQAMGRF